jgi:hypothetical protein
MMKKAEWRVVAIAAISLSAQVRTSRGKPDPERPPCEAAGGNLIQHCTIEPKEEIAQGPSPAIGNPSLMGV